MKNIKNYYKDYNVVEIKEGLVALNLKFIEDKFFDKFTRSEKPQITAEEADIERACEWLDAKKAAEEAAYEKQLDEAVEAGKGFISFQPNEVVRPIITHRFWCYHLLLLCQRILLLFFSQCFECFCSAPEKLRNGIMMSIKMRSRDHLIHPIHCAQFQHLQSLFNCSAPVINAG